MSARRTVVVVSAFGCEWSDPVGVCMSTKAATRLIKDIKDFLKSQPEVDFNADDWDKQQAKNIRYLKRRPWGEVAARADDFRIDRVLVRWQG
mgnify:CR=1 FL=1